MSCQLLIWFAVGRFLYGLTDRWNWKFCAAEVLCTGAYLISSWYLLAMDSPAAKGLLIAGVFLLTSLASRLVVKRHPVEASDPQRKRVAVGIIDFTWCSILAGALGILVFFTCTPLLADISPSGPLPLEFVQAELSSTMFLLEKTIDSVFLLGGILAGCMGILWAGEIWRKSDSQSRRKYRSTTVAAIRMTIAYFVTIINILYWVAIPLYIRLGNLSALLKK